MCALDYGPGVCPRQTKTDSKLTLQFVSLGAIYHLPRTLCLSNHLLVLANPAYSHVAELCRQIVKSVQLNWTGTCLLCSLWLQCAMVHCGSGVHKQSIDLLAKMAIICCPTATFIERGKQLRPMVKRHTSGHNQITSPMLCNGSKKLISADKYDSEQC